MIYLKLQSGVLENKTQVLRDLSRSSPHVNLWRENEEVGGEWGNGERMRKWREIHPLHFLIFSLSPPSLSISYIKNCCILLQNVKNGTFVANVTKKNLTYAQWDNDSGSNSLRESTASWQLCAGLAQTTCTAFTGICAIVVWLVVYIVVWLKRFKNITHFESFMI